MTPTDYGYGTGAPAAAPAPLVGAPPHGKGYNKEQYIEIVARVFGFYDSSATAAGTTTTFIDGTTTRFGNDYWNNANFFARLTTYGQAPEGESSYVTDFDAATGTFTLSPALSAAMGVNDRYQLYTTVSRADIIDALNQVALGAEVATSLVPSTTQVDYYVTPAKWFYRRQQIIGVWLRPAGDLTAQPIEIKGWQFEDAEGVLYFRIPYTLSTDDQLWFTYYGAFDTGIGDCEYLNLPLMLVRTRAVVYLLQNKLVAKPGTEFDKYGTMLRSWLDERAQEERMYQRVKTKLDGVDWPLKYGAVPYASTNLKDYLFGD